MSAGAGTSPVGPAGRRPAGRTILPEMLEPGTCPCNDRAHAGVPCHCPMSATGRRCACCRAGHHDGRCLP